MTPPRPMKTDATARKKRPATAKPGTRAGVSETIVEMAAESIDPAMWVTMQLVKPGQTQPATVGEAHERIKSIMSAGIDMAMKGRWNAVLKRLNTLAVMYEQMVQTARDPMWQRTRRVQAETMREAMGVVREEASVPQ